MCMIHGTVQESLRPMGISRPTDTLREISSRPRGDREWYLAHCTVGGRQSEAINAFVACGGTYSGRSTRVLLGSNMLQRQSIRPNQDGTAFRSITFTPVTMLPDRRKWRQASWHCQKVPQSTAQKVDLELAQVGYSDNLLACQQLPERLWQLNVSGSQVCCSDRTHRTQMDSTAGRTRVLTRRIVLGG